VQLYTRTLLVKLYGIIYLSIVTGCRSA
jgi:hypothetical protein